MVVTQLYMLHATICNQVAIGTHRLVGASKLCARQLMVMHSQVDRLEVGPAHTSHWLQYAVHGQVLVNPAVQSSPTLFNT